MAGTEKNERIIGIDLARSFAILLAMASHVWVVTGLGQYLEGPLMLAFRMAMALSTPTFIILFGSMLQLVYQPRFTAGKGAKITLRLWSRAVQCWLLYAVSVVFLYLFWPDYSLLFSISTALGLGVTPFTDILKFYAFALALAPLLLWANARFGLWPLFALAVLVHLAHPVLRAIPGPEALDLPKEIDRLAMFFFGIGQASLGGPSVLHGLTLVVFGMIYGKWLRSRARRPWRLFFGLLISAGALLIGALALDIQSLRDLGNMVLRMDSAPLYFTAGLFAACALTTAAVLLTTPPAPLARWNWDGLTFFGRTSMFTFSVGNMLLYAVQIRPQTLEQALWLALALMMAITIMSWGFDWAMRRKGGFARIIGAMRDAITHFVEMLFAARIAHRMGGSSQQGHKSPKTSP